MPSPAPSSWAIWAFPALLLGVLLIGGCEGSGPFRTTPELIVPPVAGGNYHIGFIEFDEQGWFWMAEHNRAQVLAVQKMITEAAQLDGKQAKTGIILLAFVHGWENNADPAQKASNAQSFQDCLASLAADEQKLHPQHPRPVVGVYIAWPGLSVTMPVAQWFTFYSRKDTGDRVGSYGGVTEVLSRLEALTDLINHRLVDKTLPPSFYAVVGHSFGSQVVYDSLLQIITERVARLRAQTFVDTRRLGEPAKGLNAEQTVPQALPGSGSRRIQPFGDLVVLINPAFEAERYYNLRSLTDEIDYGDAQRPILAIFGSKGDSDTRVFFPLGRYFSTLFQRYRNERVVAEPTGAFQRDTNHHTIPWTASFVTHSLMTRAEYDRTHPEPPPFTVWNQQSRVAPIYFSGTDAVLERTAPGRWTPFYVVSVDPSLIADHGDIWERSFLEFLSAFIASTNPKNANDSASLVRDQNAIK